MTKIWRYVVRYDDGFAPCIEQNFCTLTCCKPRIRRYAEEGDWIVGFHSSSAGKAALCYVMRVTEAPLPFAQYWAEPRFQGRRDNVYRPTTNGLVWVKNAFNDHDDVDCHKRDFSGVNALISDEYWYFAKDKSFSLYDHLDHGAATRLWYQFTGQKYNGLLDDDLGSLLRFLEANFPKGSTTLRRHATPSSCKPRSVESQPSVSRC